MKAAMARDEAGTANVKFWNRSNPVSCNRK